MVMRFGHDWDQACMQMDEVSLKTELFCLPDTLLHFTLEHCMQVLAAVADQVKNFAVIYLIDISEVPDFNTMYELYDPCTCMFFFRNKVRPASCLQLVLC